MDKKIKKVMFHKRQISRDLVHIREHLRRAINDIASACYESADINIKLADNILKKSVERELKKRRMGDGRGL